MYLPDRGILCHYIQTSICPGAGGVRAGQWDKDCHCLNIKSALRALSHSHRAHCHHHEDSHDYPHTDPDTQQHANVNAASILHRHRDAPHAKARQRSGFYIDVRTPCTTYSAACSVNEHIRTSCSTDSAPAPANSTAASTDLATRPTHE